MKIWIIGRSYPEPGNNMAGSFELEQAKMLASKGHSVCYLACCLHPVKRIKKRNIQTWRDNNVEINTLSAFFLPRIYPIYFIHHRNKMWKKLFDDVIKRNGYPDVIHIHYPAMLMIADIVKRFKEKGTKIIVTEHWSKVLLKKLDHLELKEYIKYKDVVDKFICVGRPLANSVREIIGIDSIIVPNMLNKEFKISNDFHTNYRFVAVGRLVKIKQFDKIIEAFGQSFHDTPEVSLTIIGSGKELKRLQTIISRDKFDDRIKLLGNLNRQKTASVVSNCDCLICYSLYETFGVPIIEAWACGIPVIATTAANVIDDFDERLGVEVSPNNFDELKDAMLYVYNHKGEYDRTFIADFVNYRFSERVIYEKLMTIYQ